VGAARERERRDYGDSAGQKRGRRIIKGWKEGEYDGVAAEKGGKVAITIISRPFCFLREVVWV
jgi:hypothetical protein